MPEPETATIVSWRPPEDSWDRLLSVLAMQPGPAAMVVHARVMPRRARSSQGRSACRSGRDGAGGRGRNILCTRRQPVLPYVAMTILEAASRKVLALGGPLLAARIFAVGAPPLSPVLLATIGTSLHSGDAGSNSLPGGMQMRRTTSSEILSRLSEPEYGELFSPEEATAFLRTPVPVSDGKWIEVGEHPRDPLAWAVGRRRAVGHQPIPRSQGPGASGPTNAFRP